MAPLALTIPDLCILTVCIERVLMLDWHIILTLTIPNQLCCGFTFFAHAKFCSVESADQEAKSTTQKPQLRLVRMSAVLQVFGRELQLTGRVKFLTWWQHWSQDIMMNVLRIQLLGSMLAEIQYLDYFRFVVDYYWNSVNSNLVKLSNRHF